MMNANEKLALKSAPEDHCSQRTVTIGTSQRQTLCSLLGQMHLWKRDPRAVANVAGKDISVDTIEKLWGARHNRGQCNRGAHDDSESDNDSSHYNRFATTCASDGRDYSVSTPGVNMVRRLCRRFCSEATSSQTIIANDYSPSRLTEL